MKYSTEFILGALLAGICILFGNPSSTFAQADATLRVLVTSVDKGTPIAGANVILNSYEEKENGKYEIIEAGVTDKDGFQEFRGVSPRRYRLKISYIGYKTYREVITIEAGETQVKQIELATEVGELDEIIVESEREVTTGEVGVRRISDVDLGRIPTPGPGGDLASYLQTLPGVVSTGDRGGNLYIRGGTPSQNKVMVDNMPVTKPFHISNLFSAFPEKTVQSVDMYAGGFGAKYLGATSAVIDVNLRPGNMNDFSGQASLAPHLVSMQMEGPIETGQESFMFMGRKSLIDYTSEYVSSQDVPIDFYDLTARYSYQADDFYCNITGMRTYDSGEINPTRNVNLTWANTALGGRCRGFDERYNHPFTVTAGYSSYRNTEKTPEADRRTAQVNRLFIKFEHEEEFLGLPVDYGFGVKYRTISAELAERFTSLESFDDMNLIPHAYATTVWKPSQSLAIRPGFGSLISLGNRPTIEPRLRIAYRPGSNNNKELSLALGSYSQLIDGITDERDAGTVFTVYRPNTSEEEPQKALHAILGYQQRFGRYFKTNVETYVKRHENIPVSKWTPESKLNVETALAEGLSYGFDVRLEYSKFPFYMNVSYGWGKVEYEAESGNLGAWIEEPIFSYSPAHDQRHKINAVASYTIAGFKTNISWEFGSGKPYTQVYGFDLELDSPTDDDPLRDPGTARTLFDRPYGERLPVYHRLDISVQKSFDLSSNVGMDLKAGCINTYNRDNIFYFDLNTLERVNQTPLLPYVSVTTEIN